jgi:hypothetical protein
MMNGSVSCAAGPLLAVRSRPSPTRPVDIFFGVPRQAVRRCRAIGSTAAALVLTTRVHPAETARSVFGRNDRGPEIGSRRSDPLKATASTDGILRVIFGRNELLRGSWALTLPRSASRAWKCCPSQTHFSDETRFILSMRSLLTDRPERFRLTIPLADAFAFAMGWSDLGYARANDAMRRIMGLLVIDALEYSEQWRASARVRECLLRKWPGNFCP